MVNKYTKILDNKTGRCIATDVKIQGFTYTDATIFDGAWYVTSYLANNKDYLQKLLSSKRKQKQQEITDAYDKACKYGLATVKLSNSNDSYLANRAWLETWNEAISGLEYKNTLSSEPVTSFVRLYKKAGDFMYKNVNIDSITVDEYKSLKLQLIDYRFNNLQVKRDLLYTSLYNAKTAEEIDNIKVDFGETLDEQNEAEKIISDKTSF